MDEIFPDKEHFGRIFRNNAKMSSMGITQISVVMGSCVGRRFTFLLCRMAIIVDKTVSIFLAVSYYKAQLLEKISITKHLGGAIYLVQISGVTDYKAKDDKDALDKIRSIMDKIGDFEKAGFNRKSHPPKEEQREIYGIIPRDRKKPIR